MTATELNAAFAEIIDEVQYQMQRFAKLRDESNDEAWEIATTNKPWADLLCDVEYEVDNMVAAVRQEVQTACS